MSEDQTVRLTVDVPVTTKQQLEKLAKKRDVSVAHLLRRGIDHVLGAKL